MSEETFVSAESVGGDVDRRKFLAGIIGVVAAAVACQSSASPPSVIWFPRA